MIIEQRMITSGLNAEIYIRFTNGNVFHITKTRWLAMSGSRAVKLTALRSELLVAWGGANISQWTLDITTAGDPVVCEWRYA